MIGQRISDISHWNFKKTSALKHKFAPKAVTSGRTNKKVVIEQACVRVGTYTVFKKNGHPFYFFHNSLK